MWTRQDSKKSVQKIPRVEKKFKPMNLWVKILKKQPPAACGRLGVALRATWGVWRPRPEQILRPCNNQSYTPTPIFPEIKDQRRKKKDWDFFWIYNILFATKKTTEIGLTMCRKVRFHVWKLIWNGLLKGNVHSESQRSQSKKKNSGFKKVVQTGFNRVPWPPQPDISVWENWRE